jgi:hypothetical protein
LKSTREAKNPVAPCSTRGKAFLLRCIDQQCERT